MTGINAEVKENTSGMGDAAVVPESVQHKFNWGAFCFTWIWGLVHKSYITLIYIIGAFIPFVNLGLAIWFGIKGNEWAWRNKKFESEEAFHENQKIWATVGVVLMILGVFAYIFVFSAAFMAGLGTPPQ